ncbi:MAG TPA: hypothetical protein VNA20_18020 [Frankiaceae bacterium]|nr:hypothetical protein [Frankiaceae bacterium]
MRFADSDRRDEATGRPGRAARPERGTPRLPRAPATTVLSLQRAAGNAAVSRALAPEPAAEPLPDVPLAAPATEPNAAGSAEVAAEAAAQAGRVDEAAAAALAQVEATGAEEQARTAAVFKEQQAAARGGLDGMVSRVAKDTGTQTRAAAAVAGGAKRQIEQQAVTADQGAARTVGGMADDARQHADAQATRARTGATERTNAAKASPPAADPDIAAGQRRIADTVGQRARTELGRSGDRTASEVRARSTQRQRAVYDPARRQATEQVRTGARDATRALDRGAATTAGAVSRTATKARDAARQAYGKVSAGLAAGDVTARTQLRQWVRDATSRIRIAAARLREAILVNGTALARHVTPGRPAATARATGAVRGAGDDAVAAVTGTAEGVRAGATQLAQGHVGAVAGVGGQAQVAFRRAGDTTGQALAGQAAAFTQHAEQAKGAAVAELQQVPQRASAALATEHAKGREESSGAVAEAARTEAAWATDAAGRARTEGARYEGEAQRLAGDARQANVQRLFEFVDRMRNWLREKCGNILGGILSGILLALPAILLTVGLILAGPVGWVTLAVLFVVGAGLGIYGRFAEFNADHGHGPSFWQGVGLVLLGIADITGIPYIVEAAVGHRAFAPKPMGEFERWERGTQGVINLALIVAGGAKRVLGKGGAPGERPPGVPPERVPGEAIPDRPPGETVPARAPVTRARMTELVRDMESGRPVEFTADHADALRMNAELASGKWASIVQTQGRAPWASIRNQMMLTRWRFLPRAPEAAQVLRNALNRLPDGPEKVEMLGRLDAWLNGSPQPPGPTPVPVPNPPYEDDE